MSQLYNQVKNNSINAVLFSLSDLTVGQEYQLSADITHLATGITLTIPELDDQQGDPIRFTIDGNDFEEYQSLNYIGSTVIETQNNITTDQAKTYALTLPECMVVVYNEGGTVYYCKGDNQHAVYVSGDQPSTRHVFVRKYFPGPVFTGNYDIFKGKTLTGGSTLYTRQNITLDDGIRVAEADPLCTGMVVSTDTERTFRTFDFKGGITTLSALENTDVYLKKIVPKNVDMYYVFENTKIEGGVLRGNTLVGQTEDMLGFAMRDTTIYQTVYDKDVNDWSFFDVNGTRTPAAGYTLYVKRQITSVDYSIINVNEQGYTIRINSVFPNDASQTYTVGFWIVKTEVGSNHGTSYFSTAMVDEPLLDPKSSFPHDIRVTRRNYPDMFADTVHEQLVYLRLYVNGILIYQPGVNLAVKTPPIPAPPFYTNMHVDFNTLQLIDTDNQAILDTLQVLKQDGSPAVAGVDYEIRSNNLLTQPNVYIKASGLPNFLNGYTGDELTLIYTFSSDKVRPPDAPFAIDNAYIVSLNDVSGATHSSFILHSVGDTGVRSNVRLQGSTGYVSRQIQSELVDPEYVLPYNEGVYQAGFTIFMTATSITVTPYFNGKTYGSPQTLEKTNPAIDWSFANNLVINRFGDDIVDATVQHYRLSLHKRTFNAMEMYQAYVNRLAYDEISFVPYSGTDLIYRVDAQNENGFSLTNSVDREVELVYDLTGRISSLYVESDGRTGKTPLGPPGSFTPMLLSDKMNNNKCFDGFLIQGSGFQLKSVATPSHITKTNTTGSYSIILVCRITQQLSEGKRIFTLGNTGLALMQHGGGIKLLYEGQYLHDTLYIETNEPQSSFDKDIIFIIRIENNNTYRFEIYDIETNKKQWGMLGTFTFDKTLFSAFHDAVSVPFSFSISQMAITEGLYLGEVIIYNRYISDLEVSQYVPWLQQKWSPK